MTGARIDRRLLLILYILALILLREWLIPVIELTDSDHLTLFLIICCAVFFYGLIKSEVVDSRSYKNSFHCCSDSLCVFWKDTIYKGNTSTYSG